MKQIIPEPGNRHSLVKETKQITWPCSYVLRWAFCDTVVSHFRCHILKHFQTQVSSNEICTHKIFSCHRESQLSQFTCLCKFPVNLPDVTGKWTTQGLRTFASYPRHHFTLSTSPWSSQVDLFRPHPFSRLLRILPRFLDHRHFVVL